MPNYTKQEVEALLDRAGLSSLQSSAIEIAGDLAERSKLNQSLYALLEHADVASIVFNPIQD
jgi:hypothetical protein